MNTGAPSTEQELGMDTMQREMEKKHQNLHGLVMDLQPALEAAEYFNIHYEDYKRSEKKLNAISKKNVIAKRSFITGIIGAIITFFLIPLLPIERTLGQLTDYQMRFCGAVVAIIATGIGGLAFYGLGRFCLYAKRKSLKGSMENSEEKAKRWYKKYQERREALAIQRPGILD